jgi:hypothetical protein
VDRPRSAVTGCSARLRYLRRFGYDANNDGPTLEPFLVNNDRYWRLNCLASLRREPRLQAIGVGKPDRLPCSRGRKRRPTFSTSSSSPAGSPASSPEVDLIGVDVWPYPASVCFVGSIKWREESPFTVADLRALERDLPVVPGVTEHTPRVAVARTRVDATGAVGYTAEDIINAWRISN